MPRTTETAKGHHLIKPSAYSGRLQVQIPRLLAAAAGMDGSMFVGAMTVGKCVIITQVNYVNGDDMAAEMAKIFDRAIAEWQKKKP